jgi:hypothetical protein
MLCRRGYIREIPPSKKRNDMSRGISVKEAKKNIKEVKTPSNPMIAGCVIQRLLAFV